MVYGIIGEYAHAVEYVDCNAVSEATGYVGLYVYRGAVGSCSICISFPAICQARTAGAAPETIIRS